VKEFFNPKPMEMPYQGTATSRTSWHYSPEFGGTVKTEYKYLAAKTPLYGKGLKQDPIKVVIKNHLSNPLRTLNILNMYRQL
jgi:hypothetical protein